MSAEVAIVIDFYSDWIKFLRGQLEELGYQVDPNKAPQRVSFRYFNVRKRQVEAKLRRVLTSREFCCPEEYRASFELLKEKAEKGEDLTPHLSTFLLDADFNDSLLNDWGIHHFHLGIVPSSRTPGFVERTGPVLFARVTADTLYCIDVMSHGKWEEKRLLEIIHANWPDSLKSYRLNVHAVTPVPTAHETKQLRKAGVLICTQLNDGTVYAPIGGGIATSGIGNDVVDRADHYTRFICNLEDHVRANSSNMLEKIYELGLVPATPPKFGLVIDEGGVHAFEEGSGTLFFLTQM